jgi:MFS transporter, FHS family, L-fucose permease
MAIIGGPILPVLQGAMADHIGLQHASLVPLICYLYVLYLYVLVHGLSGSKPNSERYARA